MNAEEMKSRAHAAFSASAASRWCRCPGSVGLSEGIESKSSADADEGTRAHAYAAFLLAKCMGIETKPCEPDGPDMRKACEGYAAFCLERSGERRIETRVDYSHIAPGGFGTSDYLCWSPDGVLHVIDFKYGQGIRVEAEANPQLMLYALGALHTFGEPKGPVMEVELAIYQPRMNNVSVFRMKRELLDWTASLLKEAVTRALAPKPEFHSGEWCRFCPAKGKCREHARQFAGVVESFEKGALPPDLTDAEITKVLSLKSAITAWLSSVEEFALDCARHGHQFDGFELRSRSVRTYTDEGAVAKALAGAGIDPYTRKIKALTTVEKEVGKKKAEEILSGLIRTTEGRQSLVALK